MAFSEETDIHIAEWDARCAVSLVAVYSAVVVVVVQPHAVEAVVLYAAYSAVGFDAVDVEGSAVDAVESAARNELWIEGLHRNLEQIGN